MLWRSFPQWILNIFIIQDLRIYEPLNVTTTCLSACSVVCGLAEYLALSVNADDDEILDYPFSTTIWGMLTILTDTMLRGIFLAYAMTIIKILVILIPIVYVILMLITILIIKRKEDEDEDTHKKMLSFDDVLGILYSFVCSATEAENIKYTFRLMSKCIFTAIIVVTALSIGQIFLQN